MWIFRLRRHSFGLTAEYKIQLLEEIFILVYYGRFSHDDAMNLPIWKRTWFKDRIIKEIEKEQPKNTNITQRR